MSGYFKASIAGSPGVQADAAAKAVQANLEDHFKEYMISPFTAINKRGWFFVYGSEIGVTSGFGHLIDHMVTNRPIMSSATVTYLTNQKFGNKPPDTKLPLTDHNSVRAAFVIPADEKEDTEATCVAMLRNWFKLHRTEVPLGELIKVFGRIDPESEKAVQILLEAAGYRRGDCIEWENFEKLIFSRQPIH